jgi:hypothetical protein
METATVINKPAAGLMVTRDDANGRRRDMFYTAGDWGRIQRELDHAGAKSVKCRASTMP